tara:strand:+ start:338 stop:793 length:456 start_codon:yes stop_codon:yes gene_type:complete
MSVKIIANNKKARHDYHLYDNYEAGLVLKGSEVKSIRENKCNIKEAYVRFINNELYIIGMYIGEYSKASYSSHKPTGDRKLLVNKKELIKLKVLISEKGNTLIPTSIYFKNGMVKLSFAVAKGKKNWDKRTDKINRDVARQIDRKIKESNK